MGSGSKSLGEAELWFADLTQGHAVKPKEYGFAVFDPTEGWALFDLGAPVTKESRSIY